MSTWRTVFRLEWRILRKDRSALLILAIFAVLLVVAALAGGRHASEIEGGLERQTQLQNEHMEALGTKLDQMIAQDAQPSARDPRDPVWMGQDGAAQLATLPPAPLAAVAVGKRHLSPQAVRITTGVHVTAEHSSESAMSGPTRLMTGAFDPAFLFVVLFPLVIIALSYELLSGERERGTLAMLLSQPISQGALVMGKAGARAVGLMAVTVVFALVGLVLAGADLGSGAAWGHGALYGALLLAWTLFWFATAVAVNSTGQTSARNALTLVGLWLLLVVVVPGLTHVAVDTLYPPPSRVELLHEVREASLSVEQKLNSLQGRHDVDPGSMAQAQKIVEAEEELLALTDPAEEALHEKLRQRHEINATIRLLSPALIVQMGLEDIAGSGQQRQLNFEAQADDYHDVYRAFFVQKVRAGQSMTPADMGAIPRFEFKEEPAGVLAWRVLGGVLTLLLLAMAALVFARPGLRRIGRLTR